MISANMDSGVNTGSSIHRKETQMNGHTTYQLDFTKPWNANPDNLIILSGFQQKRDHSLFMSFKETVRGCSATLKVIFLLL